MKKVRIKCSVCKELPVEGKAKCQKHLDISNQRSKNENYKRQNKKTLGICYDCSEKVLEGKTRCVEHLKSNVKGVMNYLKSNKGLVYLEGSVETRRQNGRKSTNKAIRTTGRFTRAKGLAKQKEVTWNIGKEDYIALLKNSCFYCGLENNVETGIGLDRLDTTLGYSLENCVNCCWECNVVRSNLFTIKQMKIIGQVIRKIKLDRLLSKGSLL